MQKDAKILIGGVFTFTNTTQPRIIARLNSSGSLDTSFSFINPHATPKDYVSAMALQDNNKLLIGGAFKTNQGYYMARLNTTARLKNKLNLVSSANPASYGQSVILTATVNLVSANERIAPGELVTFTIGNLNSVPIALVAGTATYITNPATNSWVAAPQ